jgi:opacity protein-like surface antigen
MRTFLGGVALAGLLLSVPASADVAYTNGDVNGTIVGWTISSSFSVADSFTLLSSETLNSVSFGAWVSPGDTEETVDWAIVDDPADCSSGTSCSPVEASGAGAALTPTFDSTNSVYNVDTDTFSLPDVVLGPGTYWLALYNATTADSGTLYWDENDGPSEAWENVVGYLTPANSNSNCTTGGSTGYCSESFTIFDTGSAVPEPGTVALGGFGLLLLGGLRRKLKR